MPLFEKKKPLWVTLKNFNPQVGDNIYMAYNADEGGVRYGLQGWRVLSLEKAGCVIAIYHPRDPTYLSHKHLLDWTHPIKPRDQ